ncbi:hypothetical protein CYMTET_38683 [Cymbomonas tetramitiformis]|uniref:Cystatin domain-containing protein n=1 Tax=Cymbomonas tetramitiformis TaxID=36881 RepID=A0AAE0BXW0_9CHLO|nr:hypothetical protein CYMTET_46537 [Cymbomonas tetramitiformis]KAK3252006.1 hypothetical protein CYMTET_38683 [Cymbomonas tetramitiformis]
MFKGKAFTLTSSTSTAAQPSQQVRFRLRPQAVRSLRKARNPTLFAMAGGLGVSSTPDAEQTEIAKHLKSAVETKLGTTFSKFDVEEVRTQVVAGTNYFFKVATGDDSAVHLRVFKGLPHTGGQPELVDAVVKTATDAIDYF